GSADDYKRNRQHLIFWRPMTSSGPRLAVGLIVRPLLLLRCVFSKMGFGSGLNAVADCDATTGTGRGRICSAGTYYPVAMGTVQGLG
ncbi:MAG: hypothetical protein ACLR8Y_18230, partial [Alistipes indistinctus]